MQETTTVESVIPDLQSPQEVIEQTTDFLSTALGFIKSALPTIIFAIVVFLLGTILVKIICKIIGRGMNRSNIDDTATGFLKSLISIILYTLLIVIVLSILGVPMTSIVTVIGAAGLAIGLALQNSLSNVAGGFIILFAKPFKAGDFIETSDAAGTVESVNILYTTIVTPDNKTVYLPNGIVSNAKIINFNEKGTRRLDLEFSISYDEAFDRAKKIIANEIAMQSCVKNDPVPEIVMGRHDSSAITIFVRMWVNAEDYWAVHFSMLENVKRAFDREQISIPFPQLDVHLEK